MIRKNLTKQEIAQKINEKLGFSREEAYKVVNDLASAFRSLVYYAFGNIYVSQDKPATSIYQFNTSNVVDGLFNYSSSAKKARHTVAIVRYNDKNNSSILKIRDSISKHHIPGPVENTFMSIDPIYTPNSQQINIGGKQILETRGLWEIQGQFMAGPFLNYQFKSDTKQDEYIMLDGFVYSPGSSKREYVFELEAIMRSIKN